MAGAWIFRIQWDSPYPKVVHGKNDREECKNSWLAGEPQPIYPHYYSRSSELAHDLLR
jgi:hypothetical protein